MEEACIRAKGERDEKVKEREQIRADDQKNRDKTTESQNKADQEAEEVRRGNPVRTAIEKWG